MITKKQEKAYHDYLVKHINAVNTCYILLTGQSLEGHDASKTSKEEFEPYARYFYDEDGNKNTSRTKKESLEFDYAWLHHIHNNPHHWQYWVLVNDEDGTHALEMPERYLNEMIADWGAFSLLRKDPNDIIRFWESHKGICVMHRNTVIKVDNLVQTMSKKIAQHLGL